MVLDVFTAAIDHHIRVLVDIVRISIDVSGLLHGSWQSILLLLLVHVLFFTELPGCYHHNPRPSPDNHGLCPMCVCVCGISAKI